MEKERRKIKSYVKRQRKLSASQIELLNKEKTFLIENNEVISSETKFNNSKPLIVEIGFGNGELLLELARKLTNSNLIGIEVYRAGIVKVLKEIKEKNLENIKLIEGDASQIIENFDKDCVKSFFILFPDPWKKRKQNKRRLIKKEFVNLLLKKLKTKGKIYISTDIVTYKDWIENVMEKFEGLEILKRIKTTNFNPKTKFSQKGEKEGNKIYNLVYQKLKD